MALRKIFHFIRFSTALANQNLHPDYRPDIDGLRAIAIFPVVAFHAFPNHVRSGYVGVDIFFVISGYLISCIIFKSIQGDRFSFLDFYERRVNRLFPALLLVLTSAYLFAWFALFPSEYRQFGKHMAAGAGYVENLVLWQEAGYFDLQSQLKPLMHLWSLSVEEQFYLIFPVAVWGAWSLRKNVLLLVAGLAALSFFLNVAAVKASREMAYFVPQTRFWELLAGALLAYFYVFKPTGLESRSEQMIQAVRLTRSVLSVVGAFLILVSIFAFTTNELYPGWWALIPVTGAALLVFSGPEALVNRTLLSNRLMVSIGLISYPLYLWHWPLLSFARILSNDPPAPFVQWMLVGSSFLLAWGTYRWVELPLRTRFTKSKMKLVVLGTLAVTLVVLGLLTFTQRMPWQAEPQALIVKFEAAKRDWEFPPKGFVRSDSGSLKLYSHLSDSTANKVLFLGDSNLEQYGPRIEEITVNPSSPMLGVLLVPIQESCDILNAVMTQNGCDRQLKELNKIAQDPGIQKIVLAVAWLKYEKLFEDEGNQKRLIDFLNSLSQGKTLFVVRNIPIDTGNLPPDALIVRSLSASGGVLELRPRVSTMDTYHRRFKEIDAVLRRVGSVTQATLVSPTDYLCSSGICPAIDEQGNFLYIDDGHLAASYARRAAVYLDPILKNEP